MRTRARALVPLSLSTYRDFAPFLNHSPRACGVTGGAAAAAATGSRFSPIFSSYERDPSSSRPYSSRPAFANKCRVETIGGVVLSGQSSNEKTLIFRPLKREREREKYALFLLSRHCPFIIIYSLSSCKSTGELFVPCRKVEASSRN